MSGFGSSPTGAFSPGSQGMSFVSTPALAVNATTPMNSAQTQAVAGPLSSSSSPLPSESSSSPNKKNYHSLFATTTAPAAEYVAKSGTAVDVALEGFLQGLKTETAAYIQSSLSSLHGLHQELFNSREKELYDQIHALESQVSELTAHKDSLTFKYSQLQDHFHNQTLKIVEHRNNIFLHYTSVWSVKNLFLAWKFYTKKSKQARKTERFMDKWEKKYFSLKYFGLMAHDHTLLKHDHNATKLKFKFETLSNEVSHAALDIVSSLSRYYRLVPRVDGGAL